MAKTRSKRKSYSSGKRAQILAAAQKEGLTAAQVQQKYGVRPVTYYSWRKKYKVAARRGGATRRAGRVSTNNLQGQLRSEVQAKIRQILPGIVQGEVNSYLSSLLGGPRRRGRPRKV